MFISYIIFAHVHAHRIIFNLFELDYKKYVLTKIIIFINITKLFTLNFKDGLRSFFILILDDELVFNKSTNMSRFEEIFFFITVF